MSLAAITPIDLALPVWAGMSFSAIGIAYQMGQARKVMPHRVFLLLAIAGTAFFAIKCMTSGAVDVSTRAIVLGVVAGLSQCVSIKLVGRAMTLGPFSLVWCMLSLTFAPVVLYAATIQQIHQPWNQWVAVGAAVLCCILAAVGRGTPSASTASEHSTPSPRAALIYGLLLVAVLYVNAMVNIAIQDLNVRKAGQSLDLFFLSMYGSIAIASFIDALKARELAGTFRRAWLPGLLAGMGSTSGMLSLGAASSRSGPAAFLICSIVTLLLPMLASVLVFRERVTARWIAVLVSGIIAVVSTFAKT
jgi:hypothetical protein